MAFSTLKLTYTISCRAGQRTLLCSISKYAPIVQCSGSNQARRSKSGLPPLRVEQINSNIQLQTLNQAHRDADQTPLVLLFGWMLAKQRHLNKYANLYHSRGYDVLTLQMRPGQVLRPSQAQGAVEELLVTLQEPRLVKRPLMVHGFSVGGYMYGEMLLKLSQHQDTWASIRQRMKGQIFDSPVDFEGVAPGLSAVLSNNKVGQYLMSSAIEGYMKLFKQSVTSHYLRASQAFHANELRLPSLLLYSRADPIGVDHRIEQVMKMWKTAGMKVSSRCWESSPHVSHFHRHPDEYVETVLAFLDSIKFGQVACEEKVKRRVSVTAEQQAF